MKAKSRFLGIDDAPFRFSDETVPVVGVVVQAPSYIEGILTTLAEVDGHDATERIASMVRRSRYRAATTFRRLTRTVRDHSAAQDRGDRDGSWIGLGDLRRCEPNRGPRGAL